MTDRVPGRNPFEPSFEQLPETLPIFPLSGVLLLPGGKLPLNVFEPRYLAMIFDALAGHRMIGMVQPQQPGGFAGDGLPTDDGRPKVHKVGCAGRIVSFNETEDGRLLLALSGICRFDIVRELEPAHGGYRRVSSVFSPYRADLDHADEPVELDRERLMAALAAFFRSRNLSTDWDAVKQAADANLVTSLSMVLPFGPAEKQALLEAAERSGAAEPLVGRCDGLSNDLARIREPPAERLHRGVLVGLTEGERRVRSHAEVVGLTGRRRILEPLGEERDAALRARDRGHEHDDEECERAKETAHGRYARAFRTAH